MTSHATALTASEYDTHLAILDYLRMVLPQKHRFGPWHVPNGEPREAAVGAKLRRMGTEPGMPDLQFLYRGRLFSIEVKTKDGRQSREQKAVEKALLMAGGHYAVCNSIEQARDALLCWGIRIREVS